MYRLGSGASTTYVVGALLVLFVIKFLFFTQIPLAHQAGSAAALAADASRAAAQAGGDSYRDLSASDASPRNMRDNFDSFAEYRYRDVCRMNSLELHKPFEPLCESKEKLLTAMSSGGRIGIDAPYLPRDCDMRWYTTEESCAILERFDRVSIVGDSMMRQMLGALYVLLRKDLGYGGVTQWNFNDQEKAECFCNSQVNVKSCSLQTIYATKDIVKWDPNSFACDPAKVNVFINLQVRYPQPDEEIARYGEDLDNVPPGRKVAFVYGHGLWNDLDVQATLNFLDRAESVVKQRFPEYSHDTKTFPRLFITPNAAGPRKQDAFILTQGNKPLMIFENSMYAVLPERNFDVLGTWNMSIQSTSLDGVHCDIKGNLIKAMMLLNWLDRVGAE
ncbi:uncharacterized protein V1518DRAFT_195262 [Limtongia smithiae]|uniref:uncharacterized protein n=1 Tax=Limtongia smithiae TaxID=1125753 RepID=UPI0034CFC829